MPAHPTTNYDKILELHDKGLKQAAIAKAAGCSEPTVSRVVNKYRNVKVKTAVDVASTHVKKGVKALDKLGESIERRSQLSERLYRLANLENMEGLGEATDIGVKLDAEDRKTLQTMAQIFHQLYMPKELELILTIISEELQDIEPDAYYRILRRLETARSDRYLD
jgi:transcriptional regulator with XRE-family HTH domain